MKYIYRKREREREREREAYQAFSPSSFIFNELFGFFAYILLFKFKRRIK